jgi:hypothetical protein
MDGAPKRFIFNTHLSLAQIHAALAYCYEHQAEFDAEIADQAKRAKAWAEAAKDSPGRQRLRAKVYEPEDMANRAEYLPL